MGGHAIIKELYTDALTDELKTLSPGTPDLHSRAARLEKAMVNAAAKSMPSCRRAKLDDPLQKQIREKDCNDEQFTEVRILVLVRSAPDAKTFAKKCNNCRDNVPTRSVTERLPPYLTVSVVCAKLLASTGCKEILVSPA